MMHRRSVLQILATALAAGVAPVPARAETAPAAGTISAYYDTLLAVMKDATKLGL